MLLARKAALANAVRQQQVAIRERELVYYTKNCRMLGDLAALIAGFAYSGIRYHYLLERQTSFMMAEGDALEEVIFLSLLTACMGLGLQTVLVAMLVAMLGPSLALRGPDGSLHDAVVGMQGYTKIMLASFVSALVMLQMCAEPNGRMGSGHALRPPTRSSAATRAPEPRIREATPHSDPRPPPTGPCSPRGRRSALSFTFGHAQMDLRCRTALSATVLLTIFATYRYSRIVIRVFRLPDEASVRPKAQPPAQHDPRLAPSCAHSAAEALGGDSWPY